MVMAISDLASVIVVGVLWGCTNPFLNQKSDHRNSSSSTTTWKLYDLFGIFLNWKFLIPYAMNQLGSAAYVHTLAHSDISLALPICNALALIFTTITSKLTGEEQLPMDGFLGVCLATLGISICFYSKLGDEST